MSNDVEKSAGDLEGILVKRKERPTSRRERVMLRLVDDIRQLDTNDIVTFYLANNTLRYYVRLLDPLNRKGIAAFHFNKKGRPSYRYIPSYTVPAGVKCALLFRKEVSEQLQELLFKTYKEQEKR